MEKIIYFFTPKHKIIKKKKKKNYKIFLIFILKNIGMKWKYMYHNLILIN